MVHFKLAELARLLIERPTPKKVYRVQFAITWRCQLSCKMCHIWEKAHENEISFDEIIRVFSNRDFLKPLRTLDITGGEPFLRSDLAEIVKYFSTEFKSANILLTTNAYNTNLLEALGKKILDTCPKERLEFSVSIDGPEDIHDGLRGRIGSYKNAIESIKALKKLGAKKITLSTTIVRENKNRFAHAYDLAQKLGVGFSTARFAQSSFYYGNPSLNDWSCDELKEVEKQIDELISVRKKSEGASLKLLRDAYFLKEAMAFQQNRARKTPCFSGTHSFFIDPYANVYPCVMLDKLMGDALKEDLEDIWFSERAQKIRQFIAEKNCACHTECEKFLSMQRSFSDLTKILLGIFKTRNKT